MSFKVCVIGCGRMAERGHGPALKKYTILHPELELTACCDIDENRAAYFQKKFGFKRYYKDAMAMLDTEKPDAVCLLVQEQFIAQLAVPIMEKGYPLLVEKSPGINREETLRMIEAAQKKDVPNQVLFSRRYTPLTRELKRLIDKNMKHGEIQNIYYEMYRVGRDEPDFGGTAIHGIDVVKFLAGSDYKHVEFKYQEFPQIGPGVANIFMQAEFKSGATAQLNFCPVSGVVIERMKVNAYNNSFFLDLPIWENMDDPGRLLHIVSDEIKVDVTGKIISDGEKLFETNGFYSENASFFDALLTGKKPQGDIASCLQSVELAECIRNKQKEYRA